MSAASVQLNVRLDKDLKHRGDEALKEAGVSASEVVRLLWTKLAKRGEDLEQVLSVLQEDPAAAAESADRGVELARRGPQLFEAGLARLGLQGVSVQLATEDWREARESSINERLAQRGVA